MYSIRKSADLPKFIEISDCQSNFYANNENSLFLQISFVAGKNRNDEVKRANGDDKS